MNVKSKYNKLIAFIGGKEVLAFSVTIFGVNMVGALMGSALSFFFTEVLFIPTAVVGTIFLVSRVWDAVNDPIMGVIVDRTNSKWGKCIPYLRYAPYPLFVTSIFLFLPVQDLSSGVKALYAGIFYILYYAFFTAVDIPVAGLQPLLFIDQEQRNRAVSISSTLGSTGSILPGGLYFALVLLVGGSEQSPTGNFIVATSIIGIGCICILLSSRKLKEKIVMPAQKKSFKETIKPIFKNKYLLIILFISVFGAPMNMSGNALVYFCTWNYADTGLGTAILFPLLQITSGASWMISVLCVPWLLKKMSKKKLFIIMGITGAVIYVILYLVGYENMWVYLIVKFFANFPAGIIATLVTLMIADTIEYAEWKTGERTEGITFAVQRFVGVSSAALVSSLTMFMLSLVKYDFAAMQKTLEQGQSIAQTYPEVLNMIYVIMTLTCSVAFILQIIPMCFYKFEGKFQEKVLSELKERRKENKSVITEEITSENALVD